MTKKSEPQGDMAHDRGDPSAGPIKSEKPPHVHPTPTLFVGAGPSEAPYYGCDVLHALKSIELEVGGLDANSLCGGHYMQKRIDFLPPRALPMCEKCARRLVDQRL